MSLRSINAWHLTLAVLAVAAVLLVSQHDAMAAAAFLTKACQKVDEVWKWGQRGIYIIGGIGVLVCAIFAFIGRFRWSLLFAIAGGVFLVATATQLFSWLGGGAGTCS